MDSFDFPCSQTFRDYGIELDRERFMARRAVHLKATRQGIKRRRVDQSRIPGQQSATSVKFCATCYHFQEFQHCSCRETSDVIVTPDKCHDWRPVE